MSEQSAWKQQVEAVWGCISLDAVQLQAVATWWTGTARRCSSMRAEERAVRFKREGRAEGESTRGRRP